MGPIRCPETSVKNYHTTPRNIPEERRSYIIEFTNRYYFEIAAVHPICPYVYFVIFLSTLASFALTNATHGRRRTVPLQ
jgi:hypothetical protein